MKWLKFGQRNKFRQQTLQVVSLLSRWCQVREDLLFAFEKCLAADIEAPMHQAIAEFLARVRGGMVIDQSLDLLQASINHENFRDLIMAIRFNFRHRGNLPALLALMEVQLHKIEQEYNNRRISNARDKQITLIILLLVPLFYCFRFGCSADIREMFMTNTIGWILLAVSGLAYFSAWGLLAVIQRRISG